jgi:hypothetical protein
MRMWFLIFQKARAMSHRSNPLRLYLLAAVVWLSAAPAFGQDANSVTLKLSAAQVAEIARLIDLQPIGVTPPTAYWDLQTKLDAALRANPDALRAVLHARGAKP